MAARSSQQQIIVDGLAVKVAYKRVKNITLKVKPPDGRIEVSAPLRTPQRTIETLVREKRSWIERTQKKVASSTTARAEEASAAEVAQWCAQVQAQVPSLIAKWEPQLGVRAGKLAYRNMRSRWGSCQPDTGRICINVRLALYPPECLEYVVVHELCHLLVRGHGADFYALLDAHLPNWRAARALLRN